MNGPACEQYFDDPESHAGHLDECGSCRVLFAPVPESTTPVRVGNLPLAPWEGSSFRSWPLIAGVAAAAVAASWTLFHLAGSGPVAGVSRAIRPALPTADVLLTLSRLFSDATHRASAGFQGIVFVFVILVNAALIRLLRRPPRGIDR